MVFAYITEASLIQWLNGNLKDSILWCRCFVSVVFLMATWRNRNAPIFLLDNGIDEESFLKKYWKMSPKPFRNLNKNSLETQIFFLTNSKQAKQGLCFVFVLVYLKGHLFLQRISGVILNTLDYTSWY